MAVYTLSFTVTADSITPDTVQTAGTFGDHQAAVLKFAVPDEPKECRYRLEIVDGSGGYDITKLLDAQNGVVSYAIPRHWTAAGMAAVRLVAIKVDEHGNETLCFHSAPANIYFEERSEGEPLPAALPAWREVMTRAETVTETVQNAYLSGAFKGEQGEAGPQGPKGEQGEQGEPGSVSYEALTPEQKKELTAEGTALCAAVAAGVTTIEQNHHAPLKFWVGTEQEYASLSEKEKENCFCLVSDDQTLETLLSRLATCDAHIAQLQTHLNESVVRVATPDDIEPKLKELYEAMPDYTVARFFIAGGTGASAVGNFYECYKMNNLYGHVEKIENASRYTRAIGGVGGGQWLPWDRFAFTYEIPKTSEV